MATPITEMASFITIDGGLIMVRLRIGVARMVYD